MTGPRDGSDSDAATIHGWPLDDLAGPDGRLWCGMIEMTGCLWNHADMILDAFDAHFREERHVVIADMSRVTAITDIDPGALIAAANHTHDRGGAVIVVLPAEHSLREEFELLGIAPLFTICETVEAARDQAVSRFASR